MRNEYDLLKVFAIILVVVGHVTNHYHDGINSKITSAIYLFHMPLFIALSGIVYAIGCSNGKYAAFVPFVRNKCKRLLLPFVFTAVFVLTPALVFCEKTELGPVVTLWAVLKGGDYTKHLWYLQSLLTMFIIAWCIVRLKVNLLVALLLAIAFSVLLQLFNVDLQYFSLAVTAQDLPFFLFGMFLVRCGGGFRLVPCLLASLCWAFFYFLGGENACMIILCRYLIRGVIIVCLVALARSAILVLKGNKVLDYILKMSFPIYLFHMSFIYAYRTMFEGALPCAAEEFLTGGVALVASIGVTVVVRKAHLQALIGER